MVAIEILKYQTWVIDVFPESKFHHKREDLWGKIAKSSFEDEIQIIELGVAWGYTTNWFLTEGFPKSLPEELNKMHQKKTQRIRMDSFDLFTGLPVAWRNHTKGFFQTVEFRQR